jgi:hypothetical protein
LSNIRVLSKMLSEIAHSFNHEKPSNLGTINASVLLVLSLYIYGISMKKTFLAVLISTLSATASASVLITEYFDGIAGAPSAGGYTTILAGNTFTSASGVVWLVGGDSVDLINAAYGSPFANVGVDLNGNAAGSISTTIATTPGLSNFTLSFNYFGNGGAGRLLTWSAGSVGSDVESASTRTFIGPISWSSTVGSSIVLTFSGDANFGNGGPTIDEITLTQTPVAAVPVPGALALMIAGLGTLAMTSRRRKAG